MAETGIIVAADDIARGVAQSEFGVGQTSVAAVRTEHSDDIGVSAREQQLEPVVIPKDFDIAGDKWRRHPACRVDICAVVVCHLVSADNSRGGSKIQRGML